MEEKKKSLLADILKREKLQKAFGLNNKSNNQSKIPNTTEEEQSSQSPPPVENNVPQSKINKEKEKVDAAKQVNTYEKVASDLSLDIRFYFLKEGEYSKKFKKLYYDNKEKLDKYGIDARKFLEYCQESFDRYKKAKNMMPLDPMKPKAYDYVEKSIKELLQLFARKFGN